MNIQAKIRPFSHPQTDRLYDAMMQYLAAHRAILQRAREHSKAEAIKAQNELIDYRNKFKRDNPHLLGKGQYSQVRLPLKAA